MNIIVGKDQSGKGGNLILDNSLGRGEIYDLIQTESHMRVIAE
jgi:hypothetical protein